MRSAERYDLQKDKWEEIAGLNQARQSHSSCSLGDSVYIFDGDSNEKDNIEKLAKATGPIK